MPKKIYNDAYRAIRKNIEQNYQPGDKYLSVREIVQQFSISLQTAQRIVTQLNEEGVVESKRKSGIIVKKINDAPNLLPGKKLLVLSNRSDGNFYSSFYSGITEVAEKYGITTSFHLNTYKQTNTLDFGNRLLEMDADGIIALSFMDSALPFYHCIQNGKDVISDVILDELPILPAVQTDNYKHAYEAGKRFLAMNCTEVLEIGYYNENSKRYKGLKDALKDTGVHTRYYCLDSQNVFGIISERIKSATPATGFFISDYAAAYLFCSLCAREGVMPKSVLAYDADDDQFRFADLPPIEIVGPSFRTMGGALARHIIAKWETGSYPEPLQRKI